MSMPPPYSQPPPKSPLAIWSLVCGLAAYVLCLGPLAGIPAIICGHLALGAIKRAAGTLSGGGMAVAGLVLGYTGTVLVGIALAMALLFPFISGAKEAARRAQAHSEVLSIVHAVEGYYTEYQRYPDAADVGDPATPHDVTVAHDNHRLFNILRALDPDGVQNPRRVVFFSGRPVANETGPRSGFARNGVFYDPWGNPYLIRMDRNGDGQVEDPYGSGPTDTIKVGVIAWSLGKDALPGKNGKDDVLSWAATTR